MTFREAIHQAFAAALWRLEKEGRLWRALGWYTDPRDNRRVWTAYPPTPYRVDWD